MRSEQHDGRFDAAIDAAARSLTAAEPSPALRAGVRDRIGRRRIAWWLVPASALAVVIVVALVGRTDVGRTDVGRTDVGRTDVGRTDVGRTGVGRTLSGPATDIRLASEHVSPPPETVGLAATGGPDKARPASVGQARPIATFEPAPEDLESPIPPIMIPPLETKQIAVDARSGVMPIEIEPLRIEPLQGE